MNKVMFPAVVLTAMLAACSSTPATVPSEPTYALTVALDGLNSAPVRVTNTTTGTVLFSDTLTGSKTFAGLKASSVLSVEGQAVNGYVAPAAQQVTVTADKTVTLSYARAALSSLGGQVRLSLGTAPYSFEDSAAAGKTLLLYRSSGGSSAVVGSTLDFSLPLPSAAQVVPELVTAASLTNSLKANCTLSAEQISDPAARLISPLPGAIETGFALEAPKLTISGEVLLNLYGSAAKGTPLYPLYADRPLHLSLIGQCPSRPLSLNLTLDQGWNLVSFYWDKYGTGELTVANSTADPAALVLAPY